MVEEEYKKINSCYQRLKELRGYIKEKDEKESQHLEKSNYCDELSNKIGQLQLICRELDEDITRKKTRMQEIKSTITFFTLKYLFRTKDKMIQQYISLEAKVQDLLNQKISMKKHHGMGTNLMS